MAPGFGRSTLTVRQIREARRMLVWNADTLSAKAQVSGEAVSEAEVGSGHGTISLFHAVRIQTAFERAGVRFGSNGAVLMGIRMEKPDGG